MNWYKISNLNKIASLQLRPKIENPDADPRLLSLVGICEYVRQRLSQKWQGKIRPTDLVPDNDDTYSEDGTIILYTNQLDIPNDQISALCQDTHEILTKLNLHVSEPIPEYIPATDRSYGNSGVDYQSLNMMKFEIYHNDYVHPAFKAMKSLFGGTPVQNPVTTYLTANMVYTIFSCLLDLPDAKDQDYPSYNAKQVQQQINDLLGKQKLNGDELKNPHSYSDEAVETAMGDVLTVVDWCIENNVEELQIC